MLFNLSAISSWFNELLRNPLYTLCDAALYMASLLLCLILHEISHGYAALLCGDPTAKMYGRLSPDPRVHLDPVGALCMLILHIGWCRPVPVNPNNFRHPSRDEIFVSCAGILTNFLLFLLSLFLFELTLTREAGVYGFIALNARRLTLMSALQIFLRYLFSFNLSLAVFNLIPVPPLDGFRLVNRLFFRGSLRLSFQTEQTIRMVFLFLCLSGLLSGAFSTVLNGILGFFLRLFDAILPTLI